MAHIRIEQNKDEFHPRVLIAETGERIKGIVSVAYHSDQEQFATLSIELAAMLHEVDITLDVDVEVKQEEPRCQPVT
ncbi:MAG TPA: hypothetical protein VFQ54_05535 [Thermomicrobiales bacterium]|nr:hypothetical protein [Thermomicrobiales bacterium]